MDRESPISDEMRAGGGAFPKGPAGPTKGSHRLRRMILGTGLVIVIVVIVLWVLLRSSGSPRFYAQMPWLTEYVASWSHSSHKNVACQQCHFGIGAKGDFRTEKVGISLFIQKLTGTGNTGVFRHIRTAGCTETGCHAKMLTDGVIEWHGVRFSHADHLGKIKRGVMLSCTTCHQSLVHGKLRPVNTSSCTICHFKNLGWGEDISRCQLCHDVGKLATKAYNHKLVREKKIPCGDCHSDVNRGQAPVDQERCTACHTAGDRAAQYDDVQRVHTRHVTDQGFPCTFCHESIEHRVHPLAIASSSDCATCHRDAHKNMRSLYMGMSPAEPGAKQRPDAMAAVHVHCQGCHTRWVAGRDGEVRRPSAKACNDCHGPGYDRILREWSTVLRRDLKAARTAVGAAQSAVGARRSGKARKHLDLAVTRLRQVETGHGQHNIVFAVVQLDGAVREANAALRRVGSSTSFPRIADARKLTANTCARCHLNPPTAVTFNGRPFPHAKHIVAVGDCESCHTPYSDHGKLSWGKQACATCHGAVPLPHPANFRSQMGRVAKKVGFATCLQCHNTPEARGNCTPCHQGGPKKAIQWHGMPVSHANHAKQGLDCTTCHTELNAHGGMALSPQECNDCHGLKMPHPDDWVETHGKVMVERKDLTNDTCSTCHEGGMAGEFCQTCHG